jgi:hypothetical protein
VIGEVDAFEVLADHVRHAARGDVDVEHRDHVGMRDDGGRLGLALEARQHLVAARELGVQHFHGHAFLRDARVARQKDPTHAAFAQQALDDVRAVQRHAEQLVTRIGHRDSAPGLEQITGVKLLRIVVT